MPAAAPVHPAAPADAGALIDYVLERFHAGHRAELPRLAALARAGRAVPGLAERLEALAESLEQHMFKEEARLFPAMQQGGHPMVAHMTGCMREEHAAQRAELTELAGWLARVEPVDESAALLQAGLARLIAELGEHMRVEDEELFPLFERGGGCGCAAGWVG